jgi:hypothetical protein
MNPYKAAIKLTRDVLAQVADSLGNNTRDHLLNQLVDAELSDLYEWISAETNGLTDQQIRNAHEFPLEGGASGMPQCMACTNNAEVHILATRHDNMETKEIIVCKGHMLDPGPLLDW